MMRFLPISLVLLPLLAVQDQMDMENLDLEYFDKKS
jgi:hypothetical protein